LSCKYILQINYLSYSGSQILVRKARTHQHLEVTVYKRLRGFTTAKVSMRYLWTGKSIYEVSMGGTPVL